MQNDVMMFKRRHLDLISIKLLKVPGNYVPPEVINKLTLKEPAKINVNVLYLFHTRLSFFRLQATKKLKPSRKAQSRSKNPLKALRKRENIKSEYSEVRSNVADKEVTRIKREQSKKIFQDCDELRGKIMSFNITYQKRSCL